MNDEFYSVENSLLSGLRMSNRVDLVVYRVAIRTLLEQSGEKLTTYLPAHLPDAEYYRKYSGNNVE